MPEVRVTFANWRPDLEENEHDGLKVADNVIHEPEGYKPVHLQTSGGFVTTGGLNTVISDSLVAKPVGSQDDLFCAWLHNDGASTTTLHVGVNGVTATTSATGYPLTFSATVLSGAYAINMFDVTEYEGRIYFTVNVFNASAGSSGFVGYMDF